MWNKLKKRFNKFICERIIQHIESSPEDAMYIWDLLNEISEQCNIDLAGVCTNDSNYIMDGIKKYTTNVIRNTKIIRVKDKKKPIIVPLPQD